MNQKAENIKESAYFEYLRSFSLNTIDSINKIDRQFKEEVHQHLHAQPLYILKKVKTLLSSYEVLALQINDSCEFVELPQFGQCILKMQLQMMGVIKWVLKNQLMKNHTRLQSQRNKLECQNGRQSMQFVENIKQKFRQRQNAKYMLKELNQQYKNSLKTQKNKSDCFDEILNQILQGKDKVLQMQISPSQNIIIDAVNNLTKKSQNANKFLEMRQQSSAQSFKCQQWTSQMLTNVKQFIDQQNEKKIEIIKPKIQKILVKSILQYEKNKKLAMVNQHSQTHKIEQNKNQIAQQNRRKKRLSEKVHAISKQLKYQKQKNKQLEKFIISKNAEYETELIKYRADMITLQRKNKQNVGPRRVKSGQNEDKISKTTFKLVTEKEIYQPLQNLKESTNKSFIKKKPNIRSINKHKSIKNQKSMNQFQSDNVQNSTSNGLIANFYSWKSIHKSSKYFLNLQSGVIQLKCVNLQQKLTQDKGPGSGQLITFVNVSQIFQDKSSQTQFQIQRKPPQCSLNSQICEIFFKQLGCITEQEPNFRNTQNSGSQPDDDVLIKFKKIICQTRDNEKDSITNRSHSNSRFNSILRGMSPRQSKARLSTNDKINAKSKFHNCSEIIEKIALQPTITDGILQIPQIKINFLSSLTLARKDLLNLFFSEETAYNYEILNYQHNTKLVKQCQHRSSFNLMSQQLEFTSGWKKKYYENILYILSDNFIKQINTLKRKNKQSYQKIRNFIRYPYSSLKKVGTEAWQLYQKQQSDIQYWEYRKYLQRILKIHALCQTNREKFLLCVHIRQFYKKMGIQLK